MAQVRLIVAGVAVAVGVGLVLYEIYKSGQEALQEAPQVPRSTSNVLKKKPQRSKQFKKECTICLLDILNDKHSLDCGHIFHKDCINQWFQVKKICPNCRRKESK